MHTYSVCCFFCILSAAFSDGMIIGYDGNALRISGALWTSIRHIHVAIHFKTFCISRFRGEVHDLVKKEQ